ncbi:DUF1344 domain-containing protein [Sinorhizobium sp. RAC02]|uniref:DUF1344 domain-containing protein n=1 Tax=Sinorhizobium sp. RAC02 TaxID=1842534 RepID=UPI00083D69EC|nr:DUF1344 domain-containing protein [Sinorhizobium sp. RAC02]AOF90582.1 hypothetical protein BSY16_1985 [Sinorhizobium sp. RAC02]
MRVLLSNLAIVTVLTTPALALAAPQMATGTVKDYNKASMSLTLNDGTTFQLPKGFHDPGLKTGEKVSVSFDMSGKNHQAKTVKILR